MAGLSWLEPEGLASGSALTSLPRPLQVIANNGPWMEAYSSAQEKTPMKRIPADILVVDAAPGFLLREQSEEKATQAWVAIIEFWKNHSEASPAPGKR
ncbi:MAG: hypothetical protein HC904_07445 [Blastochloris sp.]|nr:hypothetical protein [Blastochloris sp.]